MRSYRLSTPFIIVLLGLLLQGISATTIPRAQGRVARGRYLANLAHCFDCHSERDGNGDQVGGMQGAGRVLPPEESNIPLPHFLVCPNITPDPETGAGLWTDQQLARAIREGIGHDGRILNKMMPYWNFRYLTDEDLKSIYRVLAQHSACATSAPKTQFAGTTGD